MIFRLTSAVVRAILVVLLIATPSMLLPGVTSDATQIVALIAIFGAALTIFEYASAYPGLVEFRDAPPFNRIRFISLFASVFLLTVIARGQIVPTVITDFVTAVGALIGYVLDFPYSPVRLMVLMLPDDTPIQDQLTVRTAAGMSYLISLLSLVVFLMVLRVQRWPSRSGSFNVWVNLPTFDPTAGGDVVARLERDARFNVALGFLLPFLIPAVIKSASDLFGSVTLQNSQTMIWTVTAWAFLPASLFMRGIALGKVADMIARKRRQSYSASEEKPSCQPV
ncbi:hypothetical protein ACP2AV_02255 [Aliiroseovarius sp. PTFE2010]|uniref:hypothetical protein n=1 Tax=Aliiroseovarius sp. PTFE2010 TaxID=3417190 RepID=UPI003CE9A937